MLFKLEIIGFTLDSCILAQAAGAHRIELCDNPGEGGTTPSYGFIKAARSILHIPLYCMIRPRGGDFLYSDAELESMKTDIAICKKLGCDGVVLGLLHADGTIDKQRTAELVRLAYPMGVTFHRAFDRVKLPLQISPKEVLSERAKGEPLYQALEDVIETGCERILTSGFHPTAKEGMDHIAQLIEQADDRIIIMPGSGVRSDTVAELANETGAIEFHASARRLVVSKMEYTNPAMKEELSSVSADTLEIEAILKSLINLTA